MRGSAALRTGVTPGGALAGPWVQNPLWAAARAVPSLDLRFADSKSLVDATTGSNLVTFNRASSGTFTDSAGVLQTAATDVPRFDHNPTTGESLGLLVEEQRTNLLQRSEEFDKASWTKNQTSAFANTAIAPDGITSADSLIETASAAEHSASQAFTAVSGTAYTLSVFVKSLSGNRAVKLRYTTTAWTGAINTQVDFDLTTGAGTAITGSPTFTSRAYPNGWWRFSMTTTSTSNGTPGASVHLIESVGSSISYTGDGTSGIYLWGAQLETGAFPTSYIPTTTAAATRSADVASIGSSAFTSFYNQREGTMFVEYNRPVAVTGLRSMAATSNGGFDNRTTFRADSATLLVIFAVNGGAGQAIFPLAVTSGANNKAAVAYQVNNYNAAANGILGINDTVATVHAADRLSIGSVLNAESSCSYIRRICYWSQPLAGSKLQAITG